MKKREQLVTEAMQAVNSENLNERVVAAVRRGSIGIQSLISDVNGQIHSELENQIFEAAGENSSDDYFSYGIGTPMGDKLHTDQKLEVRRAIFDLPDYFYSEKQIKTAVTKLEKEGVLRKNGWSENQIRTGNYSVELIES